MDERDRMRIRAAILSAEPARIGRLLRPLAAMATMLIVVATIAFGVVRSAERDAGPRRVEVTTPGGTRVIWTLDPEFRM